MKSYRIAFITPEFPTELSNAGGLGNYLARMTQALLLHGHHPEVFVISNHSEETLDWQGIAVHRINSTSRRNLFFRVLLFIAKLLHPVTNLRPAVELLCDCYALAAAFRHREQHIGFDLVQSADYRASGLFICPRRNCRHVVRCSSAADLYAEIDGVTSISRRLQTRLELASIRRANVAYAPSRFLANHYRQTHRIPLKVIRPPVFRELPDTDEITIQLPKRFLLHFGQMMPRKGTAWLAQALPLAWDSAPDLTIVCAGRIYEQYHTTWEPVMGPDESRVVWLGALTKPTLYAVLARAEAVVLPSLVDNLPNTVIESLMMGIPVIGTAGASIDELVAHGQHGLLVTRGDAQGLADTMVSIWNGTAQVKFGFNWFDSLGAVEFEPEVAVANLLALALKQSS